MELDLQELFRVYIAEAEECLAALEEGLLELEQRPDDYQALYLILIDLGNAELALTIQINRNGLLAELLEDMIRSRKVFQQNDQIRMHRAPWLG